MPDRADTRTAMFLFLTIAASGLTRVTAALPAPPQIENRQEATPKQQPSSWFREKDYPSVAKRNEQHGRVSATLQIDRNGVPKSCIVTASSGWPSLDEATCKVTLDRARFQPARVSGKKVESSYSFSMNWKLNQR